MKIEKLSENKLRVTLCLKDMLRWNVSYENLLPNNPDTNEMFWDIIHKATEQTGMKFDNCRLIIEAMQPADDICVMIITKKSLSENRQVKYKFKRNISDKMSDYVYVFKSFNDVISFAKRNLYYCFLLDGKNSLYREGKYIKLVVSFPPELKEYNDAFGDAVCEYADLHHASNFYASYLEEHGKMIIKNNALKIIYYKM